MAFLRASLEGLRRRNADVAAQIGLAAYGWSEGKPLDWGKGGPEVWPDAQPYTTPPNSQNHLGFHIFDWYALEARAALGRTPPIFLAGMGSRYGREADDAVETKNAAIAHACRGGHVPETVIGGAFYALIAPEDHPDAASAWVTPSGKPRGVVAALAESRARPDQPHHPPAANRASPRRGAHAEARRQYVLLPRFPDGVPPHYLSAVLPWLQNSTATVGFQIEEALQATEIVIIGQPEDYPPAVRETLLQAGRPLQWVPLNGTNVAQSLA